MVKFNKSCLFVVFLLTLSCTWKIKQIEQSDMPEIPAEWNCLITNEYKINYPANWKVQRNIEGTEFCILSPKSSETDKFMENINLVKEYLPAEITVENYANQIFNKIKSKYKIEGLKKISISGQEFVQMNYTDKAHFKVCQNYYIKKNIAYIITYTYELNEKREILDTCNKIVLFLRIL